MKRRSLIKPKEDAKLSRHGASWRGGSSSDSSVKLRAPLKKMAKKRVTRSAASSILGLNKKVNSTSTLGETKSSGDESTEVDHVAECQRLREQLERVLTDHQRQEEEIVALRALAKSLKEEVKAIHEQQQAQSDNSSSSVRGMSRSFRFGSQEFFKRDIQVEQLQGENEELRRQLRISQGEAKHARACITQKLPTYKLAAVKANAELRCVKSQLQQERAHSDRLQEQLVRLKVRRDDVPARAFPDLGNNQNQTDDDELHESTNVRREREDFLRQCLTRHPAKSTGSSEVDGSLETVDTRRVQAVEFSDGLSNSLESVVAVKTDGSRHEDLIGLEFGIHELSLSPITSPTSSKSI